MQAKKLLADAFEAHRTHLRAVAYRILGSLSEADDAVQEAWLRLSRAGGNVDNLGGWLTTIVARVSLDMLRSRKSRREDLIGTQLPELMAGTDEGPSAGAEIELADSVGLALLVVLETLAPAERLAFVLHDMFDMPFADIAPIIGRSQTATRQLASRARRRVRGREGAPPGDVRRQRAVVEAFLAASRAGDFDALLALLDPDAIIRVDGTASTARMPTEIRGAASVARGALAYSERARFSELALVNDAAGIVVAPHGQLAIVLAFAVERGRIVEIEAIADRERLKRLKLTLLAG